MSTVFRDEIAWFRTPQPVPIRSERLNSTGTRPQAGVIDSYRASRHGCVVLLRVSRTGAARRSFLPR